MVCFATKQTYMSDISVYSVDRRYFVLRHLHVFYYLAHSERCNAGASTFSTINKYAIHCAGHTDRAFEIKCLRRIFKISYREYKTTVCCVPSERGSSVVECRTRNRVSPGSNPLWYRFEDWAFSFSSLTPLLTQLYKRVPCYRQWWKCE